MAVTTASDPVLIDTRSHSVRLGYGPTLDREEFFPTLTAVWRREVFHVEMEANRYASANGVMGEWRIFPRSTRPDSTDLARRALGDVCRPVVEAWLASDGYRASRQSAFAHAISYVLREERFSTATTRQHLARHGGELTRADLARLTSAADLLDRFLLAVKA